LNSLPDRKQLFCFRLNRSESKGVFVKKKFTRRVKGKAATSGYGRIVFLLDYTECDVEQPNNGTDGACSQYMYFHTAEFSFGIDYNFASKLWEVVLLRNSGRARHREHYADRLGNTHASKQTKKIYNFEASFYEAEDLCVAEGGHLASIHSQEENDLVYWLMTNNEPTIKESDQAWIGLRRKLLLWNHLAEDQKRSYSAWTWTDGSPVDYFEWEPAQPDNFAKSESCVQVNNLPSTFYDAEKICIGKGGHLASIHSDDENKLVYGLAKTNAWIGLRLAAPKSSLWIWTDGSPVDFLKWAPEEPHTWSAKEGCAQVFNATKELYDTH
ncbi:lectin C-type domain protein, partial [Ostertagia ostertagi]